MVSSHHCLFLLLLLTPIDMKIQVKGVVLNRKLQMGRVREGEEGIERRVVRIMIGSGPPKCFRICTACGHCQAVQVPIVPQLRYGAAKPSFAEVMTYLGNVRSNYKAMSWKCKCGNSMYDP